MRRRKAENSRRVNGQLEVEFSGISLTSYAGLELFLRYFRAIGLNGLIRQHLSKCGLSGDFGVVGMFRLLLVLLLVGGSRLRHVLFLEDDPLVQRFCGLWHLPSPRTISRWLKQFTMASVQYLQKLNAVIVGSVVEALPLGTLTVDVDGTVLCTGQQAERAFRGFNPHHRKVPSYYPITAFLAETGHMLRVKNRSGNVHDGKASVHFLRDLFQQVEETLGSTYRLIFRMDAAFFLEPVLRLLRARKADFAIKVPFWKWLDLKGHVQSQKRWYRVCEGVDFFEKDLTVKAWDMTFRVVFYRKRVFHKTAKNFQLDLFDPDDGYYEYSAVATSLNYTGSRLWKLMCGRGFHEKAIGDLKNNLAFDTIPTNHYGANSAWQQFVVILHNLITNLQIETGAPRRGRSYKNTPMFLLQTVKTLRFQLIARAGEIRNPTGRTILRLNQNVGAVRIFLRIAKSLTGLRKAA